MSRLTKKVKGKRKLGADPTGPTGVGGRRAATGGVVIDGAVYPVAGEPPRAVSKGWGNMSWRRRHW